MPDYILIQDANQKWQRAAEQDLPDEATLQRLIRENPEILPLDDLGDEVSPLLMVGRETALPNGYADVIGVDPDGLVTTKDSGSVHHRSWVEKSGALRGQECKPRK